MQLHGCAALRHILVEAAVPQSIQALTSLCSVQGVQSAVSPADRMSSRDSLPENASVICLKVGAVFNFRRATPFPMPNNREVVSHPAIA